MFTGDQMTSRQFGGWKQVTTALKLQVDIVQIGSCDPRSGLKQYKRTLSSVSSNFTSFRFQVSFF